MACLFYAETAKSETCYNDKTICFASQWIDKPVKGLLGMDITRIYCHGGQYLLEKAHGSRIISRYFRV